MNYMSFTLLTAVMLASSGPSWADQIQLNSVHAPSTLDQQNELVAAHGVQNHLQSNSSSTSKIRPNHTTMIRLSDEELAKTEAQAMFSLNYIAPGDIGNTATANAGIGFYTLGLEAILELNLNAKNMQLGCGGVNGADGCDLDLTNVSLGCIANSAGTCISLPKENPRQLSGVLQETGAAGDKNWQQQMKNFVVKNPFLQMAVKNPNSSSTREVVGLRLGAAQTSGPFSIGSINNFSGFLSGRANMTLLGETNVGITSLQEAYFKNGSAYLGIQDAEIISVLGLYEARYSDVTVNYGSVSRNNLGVELYGTRRNQVLIPNINLGNVAEELMGGLELNQSCVKSPIGTCSIISDLAGILLPILKPSVGNYIKGQLASGLGKLPQDNTDAHQWLNNYQLPFNIKNIHQIDVESNVFGLALSGQPIQYPGYDRPVNRGWSLYLPEAFTLNITDKVSSFVSTIATTSDARLGDITMLPSSYRNCWGDLKFC